MKLLKKLYFLIFPKPRIRLWSEPIPSEKVALYRVAKNDIRWIKEADFWKLELIRVKRHL